MVNIESSELCYVSIDLFSMFREWTLKGDSLV